MLICSCKGVSERKIQDELRNGARSLQQIKDGCDAGTECGGCVRQIQKLMQVHGAAARSDRSGSGSSL